MKSEEFSERNERGNEPAGGDSTSQRAPVTGTTPVYAEITSVSGSGALYTLNVVVHDASSTRAGQAWQQVSGTNQYSTYPFATVIFNQALPLNGTWSLLDAAGNQVASGTVTNATTSRLRLVFYNLPSGQASINGTGVFNLVLAHPTQSNYGAYVIDSTSGGLVIVANIDGEEDFYDVDRITNTDEMDGLGDLSVGGGSNG